MIVPVTDFFVNPLQLFPSKLLRVINIYRQKGKKRGYLQYSTMFLLVSGSFSKRKKYFETVILKLNCTFQASGMVSTMSKYQLFKKNINFSTPGFFQNDYISQENKDVTCSPFDMTCVTPRYSSNLDITVPSVSHREQEFMTHLNYVEFLRL